MGGRSSSLVESKDALKQSAVSSDSGRKATILENDHNILGFR